MPIHRSNATTKNDAQCRKKSSLLHVIALGDAAGVHKRVVGDESGVALFRRGEDVGLQGETGDGSSLGGCE
jgi:hypothetical protein